MLSCECVLSCNPANSICFSHVPCVRENSNWKLSCQIPLTPEANILYVEDAIPLKKGEQYSPLENQLQKCKEMCDKNSSCKFWTLSYDVQIITTTTSSSSNRVKRNHQELVIEGDEVVRGGSECGLRFS